MINNVLAALNWAIEKDEPLHKALRGLAGKRLRVVFPVGGSVDWAIEADGLLKELGLQSTQQRQASLAQESDAGLPDVTILVSTDITKSLRIEGDALVAERLSPLVALMKERLSPWEQFWRNSPAALIAKQVADYAIHEANMAVSRQQAAGHQQSLREFRDALERLEKRIEQLER